MVTLIHQDPNVRVSSLNQTRPPTKNACLTSNLILVLRVLKRLPCSPSILVLLTLHSDVNYVEAVFDIINVKLMRQELEISQRH